LAVKNPAEREHIEQAIPRKAVVAPKRPRRLLIFTLNVGYPGHGSIAHANYALALMGEQTGAYESVVSRDPSCFQPETLKQFDAVFFNNTVGNCFEDPQLRQSLLEFVYGGGGLLGVHGTSVAFTHWPGAREDWPEFGLLLGARGANHRDSDEHLFLKLDDPGHPVTQAFERQGFDYRDEFFRVHEPYSRNRVRVLLSINTDKCDPNQGQPRGNCYRADNDYALAWVRHYGRGRVFYCTIAHNPQVFWDPKMLQFYLAAVQFALGDLPAPTTPSARLTPPIRAQEKLGWRVGIDADSLRHSTLFEVLDKTAALGLCYVGSSGAQKVSSEIPKPFGEQLADEELKQVRFKLDAAGVRLLTHSLGKLPADEASCRRVFEFGRRAGIETFIAEPQAQALDRLERLCDEYAINVAFRVSGDADGWPTKRVLNLCQGRSKRIGGCGSLDYWVTSGIDALKDIRSLKDRLLALRLVDLNEAGQKERSNSRRTATTERVLREIHRLNLAPTMMGLQYPPQGAGSPGEVVPCINLLNTLSLSLAK
jgi:type 1 glutamine amidotransferase/sugar phosphate isomerase/epimerase